MTEQDFLREILRVDHYGCRIDRGDICPGETIRVIALKGLESFPLSRVLKRISEEYTDGRSCPAYEMHMYAENALGATK